MMQFTARAEPTPQFYIDAYEAHNRRRESMPGAEKAIPLLTADEMTGWMLQFHGLKPEKAGVVASNLQNQLQWARLQGRCDRRPFLLVLKELLGFRGTTHEG